MGNFVTVQVTSIEREESVFQKFSTNDLKTREGRTKFDKVIYAYIKELGGKDISTRMLCEKINQPKYRVHASLQRLFENRKIKITGHRNLTRYHVA